MRRRAISELHFITASSFRAAAEEVRLRRRNSYGKKILAVAPDDVEVKKVLAGCALNETRKEMRTALGNSDWPAALSLANKILAVMPGDDEAEKAVKQCHSAQSGAQ